MSKIEWTDTTWNVTAGCNAKSPGCKNCYAELMAKRLQAMARADMAAGKKSDGKSVYLPVIGENGRWSGSVTPIDNRERLHEPFTWRKPRMVFVNSMSDLFWGDDDDLRFARNNGIRDPQPIPFEFIDKVVAVAALCPQHKCQLLTKRTARMAEYFKELYAGKREVCGWIAHKSGWESAGFLSLCFATILKDGVIPNLWLGTSIENQQTADERIPHLLQVPAAVRFLSAEPLLGPVDLNLKSDASKHWDGQSFRQSSLDMQAADKRGRNIHWVIIGGESGPGARPCNVDWIRGIVDQCKAAGVPCFVKQLGGYAVWDGCGLVANNPNCDVTNFTESIDGRYFNRLLLSNKKGGDPAEWPEDLRVRQWPEVCG